MFLRWDHICYKGCETCELRLGLLLPKPELLYLGQARACHQRAWSLLCGQHRLQDPTVSPREFLGPVCETDDKDAWYFYMFTSAAVNSLLGC